MYFLRRRFSTRRLKKVAIIATSSTAKRRRNGYNSRNDAALRRFCRPDSGLSENLLINRANARVWIYGFHGLLPP
jgi:hypothetical protein